MRINKDSITNISSSNIPSFLKKKKKQTKKNKQRNKQMYLVLSILIKVKQGFASQGGVVSEIL